MSFQDDIKQNMENFSNPFKQAIRNVKDDVGDAISDMANGGNGGCCLWSVIKIILGIIAAIAVVRFLINGGQDFGGDLPQVPETTIGQNAAGSGTDQGSNQLRNNWKIVNAQDFRDGVVWVQYEIDAVKQWCCCDKTGSILFWLPPESSPTTHFANGVAIVDESVIINKYGEVVWSIREDGISAGEKIWGQDSVEFVDILNTSYEEFFGYTIVRFDVECYEYSGEMTGVLDTDGSWRLEPVAELNLQDYISDGWYYLGSSSYSEVYYDIKINEFVDLLNDDVGLHFRFRFEDHNDLVLYYEYNDDGIWTGNYNFYDEAGNKAIDLSRYIIDTKDGNPTFNDGYALLEIENEQGSDYYTIIDTTGKEMFAPRKRVSHRELKCGLYWVFNEGSLFEGQYYNVYGAPAFELECANGRAFSEGLAFASVNINGEYSFHFINTNGEIVF